MWDTSVPDWLTFSQKSPPDTWTISGFSGINNLSSIDNLLFFQAYKEDQSIDCLCIYAADKTTGAIVWSTENLAKPLIQKRHQSDPNSHMFAGNANFVKVSTTDHRLYIKINDTFYVLNSSDGSVVWEASSNYYSLQITDDEVFLVNEKKGLVAYDKESGRIRWEQSANNEEIDVGWSVLQNTTVYDELTIEKQDFITALNRSDGIKKWKISIRTFNYFPVIFENSLIFCQFDKWGEPVYLTAIDFRIRQTDMGKGFHRNL